jgi:hypothetical protein
LKHITRTVLILSFVSLFTDIASEMLYPIMPHYLKTIGFSASSLAGKIWYKWGAAATFITTACMTVSVVFYFLVSVPQSLKKASRSPGKT